MKMNEKILHHRKNKNKNGISKWYVFANNKKRLIELQEFKNRLYLVGCLYRGLIKYLDFEEPLSKIEKKFGSVIPK